MKTVWEIGERVRSGDAAVLTAADLKRRIREGERLTPGTWTWSPAAPAG